MTLGSCTDRAAVGHSFFLFKQFNCIQKPFHQFRTIFSSFCMPTLFKRINTLIYCAILELTCEIFVYKYSHVA